MLLSYYKYDVMCCCSDTLIENHLGTERMAQQFWHVLQNFALDLCEYRQWCQGLVTFACTGYLSGWWRHHGDSPPQVTKVNVVWSHTELSSKTTCTKRPLKIIRSEWKVKWLTVLCKISYIQFHENYFIRSRVVWCVCTDRRTKWF